MTGSSRWVCGLTTVAISAAALGGSPAPMSEDDRRSEEPIASADVCTAPAREFAGPCINVRARLQQGADNIWVYLWPVGTHRLLGYVGHTWERDAERPCVLPPSIVEALTAGYVVYADVRVRPTSPARAGHLQYVCIAAVSHAVIRDDRY